MTSLIHNEWPRPLRLLTGLFSTDDTGLERTRSAMTQRDWQDFVDLSVERHRIAPLVQAKLRDVDPPSWVSDQLALAGHNNAVHVLAQIAAVRSVSQAFSAGNIPFAVLKGWPLAQQLFNSSSARTARDIDILVEPVLIPQASDVLIGNGYEPDAEHPQHIRMVGKSALMAEFNNLSFSDPETGLMIELHWRCNQFAGWPELFAQGRNLETLVTSIGNLQVPTERANLLYLSIHGSMHRWSRLKWLIDIAALAKRRGTEKLTEDIAFAQNLGAARPLELGLSLSAMLYKTPCPATRFAARSWLPMQCLDEIARPEAVPSSVSQRLKFYAMMIAMAEGPRQHLGLFRYRFWGKNRLALADRLRAA